MRSVSTSRPSSDSRSQRPRAVAGQQVAERRATRCARRRRRARAPAPSRRAAWRRGRARARGRARRSRRPGCACAASRTSRRALASRTSPTSVCASRVMSRAILPIAPAATPSAPRARRPAAQRVPRQQRRVEAESVGASRCAAAVAGRARQRSPASRPRRRAAPRSAQRGSRPRGGLVEPDHPARGLEPERRRLRPAAAACGR